MICIDVLCFDVILKDVMPSVVFVQNDPAGSPKASYADALGNAETGTRSHTAVSGERREASPV